jgi:AraC-like DNA-binding protein
MATPTLTFDLYVDDPHMPIAVFHDDRRKPSPLHDHDFSELVVVRDGRGAHRTETAEYDIEPGDCFLIRERLAHGYRVDGTLTLINILFDEAALQIPLNELCTMPGYHALFKLEPLYRTETGFGERLRLNKTQLEHLISLVDGMENEIVNRRPGHVFMTIAFFMQILGYLSRCYAHAHTDSKAPRHLLDIGEALAYVERHYAEQISLNRLARIAGMSVSSLLRAFKQSTGDTPKRYHTRVRLRRARDLLLQGTRTITEIAFDVGFSDSNYFSRQFRKQYGLSPREFRRRNARTSPAG